MGTPDYENAGHWHGGKISEIPKPHVRKFPGPLKRRAVVHCQIYYSVGKHYYPHIRVEGNPIWNSNENVWQSPWHDKEGESYDIRPLDRPECLPAMRVTKDDLEFADAGSPFVSKFNTWQEARKWLENVAATLDPELYEVDWEDVEGLDESLLAKGTFVYAREGD